MLTNTDATGLPLLCLNFRWGLGLYSTDMRGPPRGGAFVTRFGAARAERDGPTPVGDVAPERIWPHIE